MTRPIVFLSDYGLQDEFVGICHGVVARVSPGTQVIDLLHTVAPHDVLRGALVLRDALRFMPRDSVFLGVVDPGVGSGRRGIAAETPAGGALVGPDNGLLSLAWDVLGGISAAVEVTAAEVVLTPVSATFHGRDVFAPAAARLSAGTALATLGRGVDAASLVRLTIPQPEVEPGRIACQVIGVDRFGNVQVNVRREDLGRAGLPVSDVLRLERDGEHERVTLPVATTFGSMPEGALEVIFDSSDWLAIVVNRGSAADVLHLAPGDRIVLGGGERRRP